MEVNALHVQSIMDINHLMELVMPALHLNIHQGQQHVNPAMDITALLVQVMECHALHAHLALVYRIMDLALFVSEVLILQEEILHV